METINQQLNALFEKWKEASLNNGEKNNEFGVIFTTDGLVYKNDRSIDVEEQWNSSKRKVLFILKDQPTQYADDVRFWLRDVEGKDALRRRQRDVAHGVDGLRTDRQGDSCRPRRAAAAMDAAAV